MNVKLHVSRNGNTQQAFTLLELLIALVILATAMAITLSTFYSITRAWQRGTAMTDNLNRGEFTMEQIASGLRSAFFPTPSNVYAPPPGFGFWLDDNGKDAAAKDVISWVKTGPELLPMESPHQNGPHRIQLSVEHDEDGESALAARAWLPYSSLLDKFDPEDEPPFFIATKIVGLNCRVSTNTSDEGWVWEESWEDTNTNTLPLAVEVALYLTPLEPGEPPVELRRTIVIPTAPLSHPPKDASL
jgi:prepilin-type N-terminal cleavage/methylation domain-containing protein